MGVEKGEKGDKVYLLSIGEVGLFFGLMFLGWVVIIIVFRWLGWVVLVFEMYFVCGIWRLLVYGVIILIFLEFLLVGRFVELEVLVVDVGNVWWLF